MKRIDMMIAIGVTSLGIVAAGYALFAGNRVQNDQVSLTFQRYSDLEPRVGEVAFLWLTNASNKSYRVSMTGNSNTWVLDTSFGRSTQSLMLSCEFEDRTQSGWTNWTQEPWPSRGSSSYLSLEAHSGVVVRVPLQADGQHRKVAVLYERPPVDLTPFWTTRVGVQLFRVLPMVLLNRVIHPKPMWVRVWCDRELSYPADNFRLNEGKER